MNLNPERFSTIPCQIIFLIITSLILIFLLRKPIKEFHPVGPEPKVISITPEQSKQWGKEPLRVKMGFSVTDFIKFDAIKNEFLVNAIVWFEFNPKDISLKTLEAFSFTKGDIVKKSDVHLQILSPTKQRSLYHIRIQFSTIMDYARFPLDDHRIFLNFTNTAVHPRDVIFEVSNADFTVAESIYIAGWQVVNHSVKSGYSIEKVGSLDVEQPKVAFALGVSKGDMRQLLLIILPLVLIFYFSIFAFSIKDTALAISLILASVSGLLAYSFVIQTLSPVVGYLMLSDYLFIYFLCSIFVIFLVMVLFVVPGHFTSVINLAYIKGITIPLLYIGLIIVWYYLMHVKDIL